MEVEWGDFKSGVLADGADDCGLYKVGVDVRKVSEWLNDGVKKVVGEKEKCFVGWLQRRHRGLWEKYIVKRNECRCVVRAAKRETQWRWGRKLNEVFVRDRKAFWRLVGRAKSGNKKMVDVIKHKDDQLIEEKAQVSEEEMEGAF